MRYSQLPMNNDKLDLVEKKCLTVLQNLRNNDNAGTYITAVIVLGLLMFLTIVILYIKNGYSNKLLIGLILTAIMFLLYKKKTKDAIDINSVKSSLLSTEAETKTMHVSNTLDYLSSGIDVKLVRIRMVRQFYFILFPIYLILIQDLFYGPITSHQIFWGLIGGAILSFIAWGYFFRNELIDLVYHKEEVDAMRKTISLQL